MFSLIITIISIALVTVLALATLYYGGSAFRQGATKANADQLILQGQQILGAADLYIASTGAWPTNIDALVTGGYLSSVPTGAMLEPALAPTAPPSSMAGWITPVDSQPTFRVNVPVSDELCKAVNLQTIGADGILAQAYSQPSTQCYHSSSNGANYVVITRAGNDLASVLPVADVAAPTSPVPASTDSAGWSTPPTSGSTGGGPATNGGTTVSFDNGYASPMGNVSQNSSSQAWIAVRSTTSTTQNLAAPVLAGSSAFHQEMSGSSYSAFFEQDPSRHVCGGALAAGDVCYVSVLFAPTTELGTQAATMTLGGQVLSLSGVAIAAVTYEYWNGQDGIHFRTALEAATQQWRDYGFTDPVVFNPNPGPWVQAGGFEQQPNAFKGSIQGGDSYPYYLNRAPIQ